jgi:hypothetical protein
LRNCGSISVFDSTLRCIIPYLINRLMLSVVRTFCDKGDILMILIPKSTTLGDYLLYAKADPNQPLFVSSRERNLLHAHGEAFSFSISPLKLCPSSRSFGSSTLWWKAVVSR